MNKPPYELVHYEAAKREIAAAATIDEAKEIRDRAAAYEEYARQALDTELERNAQIIRRRAERRCGEFLRELKAAGKRADERGSAQKKVSNETTPPVTLKDIGLTRDQSSNWQKLAELTEQRFESIVESHTHSVPSAAQIVEQVKQEDARTRGERNGTTYQAPEPEPLPNNTASIPRRTPLIYRVSEGAFADRIRVHLRNHNLTFEFFVQRLIEAALTPGVPAAHIGEAEEVEGETIAPLATEHVVSPALEEQQQDTPAGVPESSPDVPGVLIVESHPPAVCANNPVEESIRTEHIDARIIEPELAGIALETEQDIRYARTQTARAFARGHITTQQHKLRQQCLNGAQRLVDGRKQIASMLYKSQLTRKRKPLPPPT